VRSSSLPFGQRRGGRVRWEFRYIEAASGRHLVYADLLNDVPLATTIGILDIHMDTIETAIQQGY
jgi:hypothetical protein